MTKDDTVYFLFSAEQLKFRREIEEQMGRIFNVGQVIVNGERKPFTEISTSSISPRFSDSTVVASGKLGEMRYTMPKGE